ncbi:MAG: prmA 2 [Acidobacteria bacterium]|jgi:SAM-dependent methyltransferase|nr:prmA 2 [Acidobacteriota bacterium]
MKHPKLLLVLLMMSAMVFAAAGHRTATVAFAGPQESLAPFVPTPQDVVDRMLALAEVTSKDTVYDLGCGDGRIVITAAKKYGAHGMGFDIDPQRIKESTENARTAGVDNLVAFKQQDVMTVDVSPATVVTLYLLTASNLKLRPLLTKELKPGARIVSHMFSMGDWEPTKVDNFTNEEGFPRTLYLWQADGKYRP